MNDNTISDRWSEAEEFLRGGRFRPAFALLAKLVRQRPRSAALWLLHGIAAGGIGDIELARRSWQTALELGAGDADLIMRVGMSYEAMRDSDRASACFSEAARLSPTAINPRINLILSLERRHRLGEARRLLEECLAIDPVNDQVRYVAAMLDRREGRLQEAEVCLRDLIGSEPKHEFVRYASRFELAQILDRTERFDEAMRLLEEGKNILRSLVRPGILNRVYDSAAEYARTLTAELPATTLRVWNRSFPQAKRRAVADLAFLGGHPRSGTTLLEQILSAHPHLESFDETLAFTRVLMPCLRSLQDLSVQQLNVLRSRYVEALRRDPEYRGNGRVLLDKNPSPTSYLPLWLRILPELKVVIALRDPRDILLSCYFLNLPLNAVNANFLSLERTAKHYADLMGVWLRVRRWEGLAWMETRYEDVVANAEVEGRRVTRFLGLEWHPDQASFYEKSAQRRVSSPTYAEVAQPIYTRSVARWHSYEKYLAPVLPLLEPFCKEFKYS